MKFDNNCHPINERIKSKNGILIDSDGKNLGPKTIEESISLAESAGLDLVEMNSSPTVFKIMNYEKYIYELKKKEKNSKKKSHSDVVKEIKFTPLTGPHDINIKVNKAKELLSDGYKVKLTLSIQNRRMNYKTIGLSLIKDVYEKISGTKPSDSVFKDTGNMVHTIISNLKNEKELQSDKKSNSF